MAITSMTNPAINTLSNLDVRVIGTSLAVEFDIPTDSDFEFVRVYLGDSDLDLTTLSTIDYQYDTRESGTLKATPFVAGIAKKIIMEVYDTLGAGREITTFGTSNTDTQITFQSSVSGADAVDVRIISSNSPVFRSGSGDTDLTANVSIGGNLSSDSVHVNTYRYQWKHNNNLVCINNGSGQLLSNASGDPLTATLISPQPTTEATCLAANGAWNGTTCTGAVECSNGALAGNGLTGNTRGGGNRTITVGAEDVIFAAQFTCDVSNIPD